MELLYGGTTLVCSLNIRVTGIVMIQHTEKNVSLLCFQIETIRLGEWCEKIVSVLNEQSLEIYLM